MGIVCLVDRTALLNSTPNALTKYGSNLLQEKQFPWTELQQQILLGSYWFGYIFTLVPSNPLESHPLSDASCHRFLFQRWLAIDRMGS